MILTKVGFKSRFWLHFFFNFWLVRDIFKYLKPLISGELICLLQPRFKCWICTTRILKFENITIKNTSYITMLYFSNVKIVMVCNSPPINDVKFWNFVPGDQKLKKETKWLCSQKRDLKQTHASAVKVQLWTFVKNYILYLAEQKSKKLTTVDNLLD